MAAKDKVCGINLVALNDLDLGAWIDRPGDVACMDLVQKWNDTASWGDSAIDMPIWSEPQRIWGLLKTCWGFDPCLDMLASLRGEPTETSSALVHAYL